MGRLQIMVGFAVLYAAFAAYAAGVVLAPTAPRESVSTPPPPPLTDEQMVCVLDAIMQGLDPNVECEL